MTHFIKKYERTVQLEATVEHNWRIPRLQSTTSLAIKCSTHPLVPTMDQPMKGFDTCGAVFICATNVIIPFNTTIKTNDKISKIYPKLNEICAILFKI